MFHVKLIGLFIFLLSGSCFAQKMGTTVFEKTDLPSHPINSIEVLNYINQYTEAQSLTKNEKDWFYWTNYSRNNPRAFWDSIITPFLKVIPTLNNDNAKSLKKELYSTHPLPLLKPNADLARTSFKLAAELSLKMALPSHTTPSGETFNERMQKAGIQTCAGENISFGVDNTVLMLILLYIDNGVSDLGHRKSLLNPMFTEMGIGVSSYPENKLLVVQDFSCSQKPK